MWSVDEFHRSDSLIDPIHWLWLSDDAELEESPILQKFAIEWEICIYVSVRQCILFFKL